MSIQEEKLSLMSSLFKTWEELSAIPKEDAARWDGMRQNISGSIESVNQLSHNVQRLEEQSANPVDGQTEKLSGDIQKSAVKLSGHMITGTDIAGRVMETGTKQPATHQAFINMRLDAEVTQSWTDALRFIDAFCLESQGRIHVMGQSIETTGGSPENSYRLGTAAGSLETAAQVARQQYERGIRMSLQGPLAEYAAASALESGMTKPPTDGAVYGIYRAIHGRTVLVESIPDGAGARHGELFAVPVAAAVAKALHADDLDLRGKPVVYAYEKNDVYARHEPAEFAAKCRERAAGYAQAAGYQDGEGYRKHLAEAARLFDFANRIDGVHIHGPVTRDAQNPGRTRNEIVAGAVAKMNQAFGYAKAAASEATAQSENADLSASGVAFHLDDQGAVIWDKPREDVRLASAGYSVLPIVYGFGAKPEICRQGETPVKLLVEHEGRAMATFSVEDLDAAMAYVDNAKAAMDRGATLPGATPEPDSMSRIQRLEHAFHLGLLERLDSPDVKGPEVDDARNDGLSTTVRAIVRDANQNAYALVEADAVDYRQADQSTATHRLFAVPVMDSDAERLVVDEQASFLVLEWRDHCTVVEYPLTPENQEPAVQQAANLQADAPKGSEARRIAGAGLGF